MFQTFFGLKGQMMKHESLIIGFCLLVYYFCIINRPCFYFGIAEQNSLKQLVRNVYIPKKYFW